LAKSTSVPKTRPNLAQEGRLGKTGSLNRPPDATAESDCVVESDAYDGRAGVSDILIGNGNPRLRAASTSPGVPPSQLFEADYDHVAGEVTCDKCRTDRQVIPPVRQENCLKVHYELTAKPSLQRGLTYAVHLHKRFRAR
jgi:hypothetical protein